MVPIVCFIEWIGGGYTVKQVKEILANGGEDSLDIRRAMAAIEAINMARHPKADE